MSLKLPVYAIVESDTEDLIRTASGSPFQSASKELLTKTLNEEFAKDRRWEVKLIEEVNLQEETEEEKEFLAEFRQMALAGHKNHADVGARLLVKDFSECRMTFCQRRFKMCRYNPEELL